MTDGKPQIPWARLTRTLTRSIHSLLPKDSHRLTVSFIVLALRKFTAWWRVRKVTRLQRSGCGVDIQEHLIQPEESVTLAREGNIQTDT